MKLDLPARKVFASPAGNDDARRALRRACLGRGVLAFFSALVCAVVMFWTAASCAPLWGEQPWKLFADQVRRGHGDSAGPAPMQREEDREEAEEMPPIDSGGEEDFSTVDVPAGEEPSAEPSAPPLEREKRMIDFTESLGPDASLVYGVQTEEEPPAALLPPSPLPPYRGLPRYQNDATIHDIFFINPLRGWAAGDRGTLWTTFDGGKRWLLMKLPTDEELYAVRFLDSQRGIVVGGHVIAGGENGCGAIFVTADAGATWQEIPHASFPILRSIQILSETEWMIAGDSSELYPSGLFISRDAGESWEPMARGNRHSGWCSAQTLAAGEQVIGTGENLTLQTVSGGRVMPVPGLEKTPIRAVTRDSSGELWAAGDRGVALVCSGEQSSWRRPAGEFPDGTSGQFDFYALSAQEGHIVLAGNPGSRVVVSDDGGENWRRFDTGVSVPIRILFFVDPLHGWGGGDLGTIIATSDGGQTWQVQHEGGRRLAFLALLAEPEAFRPELFIQPSGQEGYLGGTALVFRPEESSQNEISKPSRLKAALLDSLGSAAAEPGRFSVPPTARTVEALLAAFDAESDNHGLEIFRESLVRLIRVWRPEVLVISTPARPASQAVQSGGDVVQLLAQHARGLKSPQTEAARSLIERELPGAILAAQSPTAYPEQISEAGLSPWAVQRVEMITQDGEGGIRLSGSFFVSSIGREMSETALAARWLVEESSANTAADKGTDLAMSVLYDRQGEKECSAMFDRLDIPYSGEARRSEPVPLVCEDTDPRQRSALRRKTLGIVGRFASGGDPRAVEMLLADVDRQRLQLDADLAVEYLTDVGSALAAAGNWDSAEEVFSRVAHLAPELPQARRALTWLIQFYSGREPFWRTNDGNRLTSSEGTVGNASVSSALAVDTSAMNSRYVNADELGKLIRSVQPDFYMNPEIRFPLAMIQRVRGFDNDALRYFMNRSMVDKSGLWGARAEAEFQLLSPQTGEESELSRLCPLSIASCRTTAARPFLDGVLEPEVWGKAERFSLSDRPDKSAPDPDANREELNDKFALSTEFGTFVSFLYDAQFLYIALECSDIPGAGPKTQGPRRRDANLDDKDRVEIELDLDRDYTTYYRFLFSRDGDVTDSCWNRLGWDARCFVAQGGDQGRWTLEIAIPWEDLTRIAPTRTDVWALAVRRIVPDHGVECWNVENSDRTEHAFGLLMFGQRP
ncbi:MAG: hypothetical protein IJH68_02170 [Thermoguttaceae bacterium]|nr:hypothetical protein [Thermoguttaceae bacterium]